MSKSLLTFLLVTSMALTACQAVPRKGRPVSLTSPQAERMETMPASPEPVVIQQPLENGDVSDRLLRLEQQLAAAQNEIIAMRPKVAKVDLIEQKFKDLSLGLDRIDAHYGMVPAATASVTAPKKPAVLKTAAQPEVKPVKAEIKKPAAKSQAVVYGMRLGEQAGFTRLVLDSGKPLKLTYDLDNDEKIMVIELSGFAWEAEKSKSYSMNSLIASYKADTTGKSGNLVILLKKPVKILRSASLPADKNGIVRTYLDIAPL